MTCNISSIYHQNVLSHKKFTLSVNSDIVVERRYYQSQQLMSLCWWCCHCIV